MANIALFISSVAVYLVVWSIIMAVLTAYSVPVPSSSLKLYAKAMGIIALLCLPVNINGNVFTVMGNAVAEKSVYSVFSVYQVASGNTFGVINVGRQKAGVTAFSILDLGYQRAGEDANNFFGLGVQYVGRDANLGVGLGYQQAGRDADVGIGLGVQYVGRDADVGIGLAPYQHAQRASETIAGLSGDQQGGRRVQTAIGLGFYQQVPGKDRAFGAWSELKADE